MPPPDLDSSISGFPRLPPVEPVETPAGRAVPRACRTWMPISTGSINGSSADRRLSRPPLVEPVETPAGRAVPARRACRDLYVDLDKLDRRRKLQSAIGMPPVESLPLVEPVETPPPHQSRPPRWSSLSRPPPASASSPAGSRRGDSSRTGHECRCGRSSGTTATPSARADSGTASCTRPNRRGAPPAS